MNRTSDPLHIVAIGGGTGLSALLRGLKQYAPHAGADSGQAPERSPEIDITAVVTVTDDGGSSGRLRRELDILPPGDIRNCMVALSEDEGLLSRLFQQRFDTGRSLKGHSFGNLFLSAMTQLTGDFAQAVALSSEVLATRGRIFPSTAANVSLEGWLEDGTGVEGETKISRSRTRIRRIALKPRRVRPLQETLDAIERADLICLGPGSLYTSIIPNRLVQGIPEALQAAKAPMVYFVNLMWQPGETMNYKASDHVNAIRHHSRPHLVDYVVLNTRPVTGAMRRRYAAERVFPVENDLPQLREMNVEVIGRNLLESGEKVRHNPDAIAEIAVQLAAQARRRQNRPRRKVAAR